MDSVMEDARPGPSEDNAKKGQTQRATRLRVDAKTFQPQASVRPPCCTPSCRRYRKSCCVSQLRGLQLKAGLVGFVFVDCFRVAGLQVVPMSVVRNLNLAHIKAG